MNRSLQDGSKVHGGPRDWRLRWVTEGDLDDLHVLASLPPVYRYLFDGQAPSRASILGWIRRGIADAERAGVGLWVLDAPGFRPGGCVQIKPDLSSRRGELLYLVDPAFWGQGLATRMARTVINQTFQKPQFDCVFAGADCPNQASIAVMRRLGMTFSRDVRYPLGPGVEYAINRHELRPPRAGKNPLLIV